MLFQLSINKPDSYVHVHAYNAFHNIVVICQYCVWVKAGSQYDAGRCVASRHDAVETQRDAGIEPNSIPA